MQLLKKTDKGKISYQQLQHLTKKIPNIDNLLKNVGSSYKQMIQKEKYFKNIKYGL